MKWMLTRSTIWFMFTVLIAVAGLASAQQSSSGAASDDAKTKALVQSKCTVCHGLEELEAAKLDKPGWKETVDAMRTRGAELKDDEATTIVDYLVRTYSADDDAETKKLVERACTTCHGLDMIESAQKSKDEWTDVTRNMISYGAEIKESQIEAVATYLAKHYGIKTK